MQHHRKCTSSTGIVGLQLKKVNVLHETMMFWQDAMVAATATRSMTSAVTFISSSVGPAGLYTCGSRLAARWSAGPVVVRGAAAGTHLGIHGEREPDGQRPEPAAQPQHSCGRWDAQTHQHLDRTCLRDCADQSNNRVEKRLQVSREHLSYSCPRASAGKRSSRPSAAACHCDRHHLQHSGGPHQAHGDDGAQQDVCGADDQALHADRQPVG